MSLKEQITDDMKAAMKSGDKHTVGVTRLINAAIKQKEIDDRIPLDNDGVLTVLQKMVKQTQGLNQTIQRCQPRRPRTDRTR